MWHLGYSHVPNKDPCPGSAVPSDGHRNGHSTVLSRRLIPSAHQPLLDVGRIASANLETSATEQCQVRPVFESGRAAFAACSVSMSGIFANTGPHRLETSQQSCVCVRQAEIATEWRGPWSRLYVSKGGFRLLHRSTLFSFRWTLPSDPTTENLLLFGILFARLANNTVVYRVRRTETIWSLFLERVYIAHLSSFLASGIACFSRFRNSEVVTMRSTAV